MESKHIEIVYKPFFRVRVFNLQLGTIYMCKGISGIYIQLKEWNIVCIK